MYLARPSEHRMVQIMEVLTMTINRATRFVDVFNAIHDAAGAMTVQTPKSPDLQELLRKLQTTLSEYLAPEPSEGILVEPDLIETAPMVAVRCRV